MARPRGQETVGDAVRSMAVLLGLVAAAVIAFAVMRPDEKLPDPIDYAGVLQLVRDEYPYRPVAPTSQPQEWRATSVDHTADAGGHRWRLGFLTDDQGFVGLEQSDGEIQAYLQDRLRGFVADGSSDVGGVAWDRHRQQESPRDRALVLVDADVVTIVRGTEPYEVLEGFAASLG